MTGLFPITGEEWLISDTHFGHKNIIDYIESRTPETEDYMLKRWREKIKKSDKVLHLGDFVLKEHEKYLQKLPGRIYLLMGNHDRKEAHYEAYRVVLLKGIHIYLNGKYEHIEPKHKLTNAIVTEVYGRRVMFSHFPVINNIPYDAKFKDITEELHAYFKEFECELNIHGHIHDWIIHDKRLINACVEYRGFEPVRVEQLINKRWAWCG